MASPRPPSARTRMPFQSSRLRGGLPVPMNSYCGSRRVMKCMAFHCASSSATGFQAW